MAKGLWKYSEFFGGGGGLVTKLCPTLCDPMDYSLPGFSVHGILQARILGWVAISFSRGSFQPGYYILVSCIAGRFFTDWATREAPGKDMYTIMWRECTGLCLWAHSNLKNLESRKLSLINNREIQQRSERLWAWGTLPALVEWGQQYSKGKNKGNLQGSRSKDSLMNRQHRNTKSRTSFPQLASQGTEFSQQHE